MSLVTQISNLATRLGTEFKTVYGDVGNLASLSTTDKASLVAAINELQNLITSATSIDDSTSGGSTTYSSSKTLELIASLKADLLGGASSAYDTLKELADLINTDQSGIAALISSVGNKVDFESAQSLTGTQKTTALSNIGAASAADLSTLTTNVGDTTTNFVTTFETSLV